MYNFSHDGVTIASMLDTRKANADKKYPVKIRVTYRRDRKYFLTGKDLTKQDWEKLPSTKSKAAAELRESIHGSFDAVQRAAASLIKEGNFSFDLLTLRLGRSISGTLNSVFQAKIKSLSDEARAGSEMYYANVLSSINRFKGDSIRFSAITVEWLKKYESWLLSDGISYTTVGIYMRAIRAIVNIGIKDGAMKAGHYPFGPGKYVIPTAEGRKIALSMADIKRVIDFSDGLEATERYRDLWFLSYLLNGINIGDLVRLKDSNFWQGEIRWYRAKTIRTSNKKREIIAIVTPEVQAIIDKWGVPGRKPNDFIFPYLKGNETPMQEKLVIQWLTKRINLKLKMIAEQLGIPAFTTYSARHSYATILKRSGANIAYISESLGHPDVKTTEHYLDTFEKDERLKNAAMLTNFATEEKNIPN